MGALEFFVSIVQVLDANPQRATNDRLDKIAANAKRFSYIGNRKTLSQLVRQEANELFKRLGAISDKRLENLANVEPSLVPTIKAIKNKVTNSKFDIVAEWLGRQWEKDDENWLQKECTREGLQAKVVHNDDAKSILVTQGKSELQLRYFVILHKRNGEHIVLQYELPR